MSKVKQTIIDNKVAIFFLLLFFSIYLVYVYNVSFNVPHMDMWLGLDILIEKIFNGDFNFKDIYPVPHGEYISPLGSLLQYISIKYLVLNTQISTFSASFCLLAESIILYYAFKKFVITEHFDHTERAQLLFLPILLGVYNLNQWEILSYEAALFFTLRIASYVFAFLFFDIILHKKKYRLYYFIIAGIICFFIIIILSFAYFPSAIFSLGVCVALHMGLTYKKDKFTFFKYYFLIALFVLVSALIFLIGYQPSPQPYQGGEAVNNGIVKLFILVAQSILVMSASVFIHQSTVDGNLVPYYIIGSLIFIVSILCFILYFIRKLYLKTYLPFMLIVYAYCNMLFIIATRLFRFGVQYLSSSRYVVETTLLFIGIVWILLNEVSIQLQNKSRSRLVIPSILILLLCSLTINSNLKEFNIAPYRKDSFKQVAYLMQNIETVSDSELGICQAPASEVRKGVETLRKYNLSIFHNLESDSELTKMVDDYSSIPALTPIMISGIYDDSWVGEKGEFLFKTGQSGQILITGYYPFEIEGNELITVNYDENSLNYYIEQELFTIQIQAEPYKTVTVELNSAFYHISPADVRKLSFLISSITGD